jgi:hypothetical protein
MTFVEDPRLLVEKPARTGPGNAIRFNPGTPI